MPGFPFYKQLDSMDCGPSCLRMVAKFYGKANIGRAGRSSHSSHSGHKIKEVILKKLTEKRTESSFLCYVLCALCPAPRALWSMPCALCPVPSLSARTFLKQERMCAYATIMYYVTLAPACERINQENCLKMSKIKFYENEKA
ncbi:MAG: hypothetical protein LLG13_05115 [Bacteroidales bacterium]|nr:hypothetical protein [Bacteroidales bacterium]